MDKPIQSRQRATPTQSQNKPTNKQLSPLSKQEFQRYTALMAQMAYLKPSQRHSLEGFEYIPQLSNTTKSVWQDRRTKRLIVSNRGTVPNKQDLKTDLAIAVGDVRKTRRFKNDKRYMEKLKRDLDASGHGNTSIHLTGHSMGATINRELMNAGLGDTAHHYNAGYGLRDLGRKSKGDQTDFRTKKDPVSLLSKLSKNKTTDIKQRKKGLIKSHGIDNFVENGFEQSVKVV